MFDGKTLISSFSKRLHKRVCAFELQEAQLSHKASFKMFITHGMFEGKKEKKKKTSQ